MLKSYYSVSSTSKILDNTSNRYVLKIRDLPEEEKPREKLQKYGPGALTPSELLAVLLGNGSKKEGVLEMSQRIIKEYGEGAIMYEQDPKKLSQNFKIPLVKTLQIIAAAELGRRYFDRNTSLPSIRTAKEVYEYVSSMRTLSKEHLRGIYLNAHYKVIHDEVISIGTVDSSIIHPREVFKPALEYSAVALILVHNHPSGVTTPSKADIEVTGQIKKAGELLGVALVDHVIITKDSFESILV